jgi:hypothetical protein
MGEPLDIQRNLAEARRKLAEAADPAHVILWQRIVDAWEEVGRAMRETSDWPHR